MIPTTAAEFRDGFEAFYRAATLATAEREVAERRILVGAAGCGRCGLATAEREVAERRKVEPDYQPENEPKEKSPFPWQARLAERVWSGDWPRAIALPTAAGKTTCLDVALFALACGAKDAARRVFFVVDRRIVVDQAFEHAKALARTLDRAEEGIVRTVADRLREIARPGWAKLAPADQLRILRKRWAIQDEPDAGKRQKLIEKLAADEREWFEVSPLAVYALRGGMYRETAWARSPLQPTVIASTVDQVGSRLLFRGYGVSDGMKPVHAGLVGNDALILLDEAHCAKPFDQTMQAVRHYRAWNESPAPFHFVSVTATPTGDVPEGQIERDNDEDRDHPVLGKRIKAAKPAKLVVTPAVTSKNWRRVLVTELAKQARALGADATCVGIIVNRVATARDLREELLRTDPENVVLLTGRMRPLDRDRLFNERLKPLLSNAPRSAGWCRTTTPFDERLKPLLSNATGTPPKFVIGTQCLEVGADFDFHALVTECASLDALRQRFGRLNRVANREQAPAVVVVRADQAERSEKFPDPVYGDSLPDTWQWLKRKATDDVFDFGVAAVREATKGEDLAPLNAPSSDAPVLFPVHLDCWVQTSPRPEPDPDPAPFLHGPKDPGQPDVQVVFRDDIRDIPGEDATAREKRWAAVVALCPPSSSEAVPVKIGDFRRWLGGEPISDRSTDLDHEPDDEDAPEAPAEPRHALRWKGDGDEDTEIVSDPTDREKIRPADLFVVPCSAPGVSELADFPNPSAPPDDYAEEAFQRSRDKALLRVPKGELNEDDDDFEVKLSGAIAALGAAGAPEWRRRAAAVLKDKSRRLVASHPTGGWVVTGRRRLKQFDPEFLDDAASSYSPGQRQVTLAAHSTGVAGYAERFAGACGLPAGLFEAAGFWHDLGKLDARFQKLLKGYAAGPPLAKSGSFDARPWESHCYPKGARHELLSAALLAGRDDLFLHLIATHHGYARPFAPPVEDADDAVRTVGCEWFKNDPAPARQDVAAWNAELPGRFWRVVRGYGWWGAAYREAVFRLADHAQSAAEQEDGWAPGELPAAVPPPPARAQVPQPAHALVLSGLDGANPLGFLAALGTLRLVDDLYPGATMHWEQHGGWRPVLTLPEPVEPGAFAARLLAVSPPDRRAITFADDVKVPYREYEGFLHEARPEGFPDRQFSDFLTAYADSGVRIEGGPNAGKTKPTAFYMIAGRQRLLEIVRNIVAVTTLGHVRKALFDPWRYDDPLDKLGVRWDPQDDVRYALRARDPSGDPARGRAGSVLGANRLAFEALPFFPSFPRRGRLATTGFVVREKNAETQTERQTFLTWPLWGARLGIDPVRSLLASGVLTTPELRDTDTSGLGVLAVFRCEKIANGDYSNLSPAVGVR